MTTTLCDAFQRTAIVDPHAVALRTPGDTATLTWGQYAAQVRDISAGLAGLGIGRGDTVALMMSNRIEFYPIEVGAQHVGATSFSVYNSLAAEQLTYIFNNAGNRIVFCEEQYIERIQASGAPIDHIVCIDADVPGTLSLSEMVGNAPTDFDFETTWRTVQPDDVATLIYTSGTTGNPKGVETTHANLMYEARAFSEVLDIGFGDRITSFLPSAHIADRFTALYLQETAGTQITVVADPKAIAAALPDCRPTIWGAVPRVWEKLKAAIEFGVANEVDATKRNALQWALSVAHRKADAELAGEPISAELATEWARADELVLSKLRAKIGLDQVRWALSGAAPIPAATLAFFTGLGIPIAEIWGMSELSCVCTVSHPRDAKLGTVGKILPGMEFRIADDGEFLVRGPLVMKGYRKEPEKTAEAIDGDGWLHTGDILTVDDDGYFRVVDRKKEIIINAAGKNMSPANIENTIKANTPLAGVVAAIGDGRPFNTALIVLDIETAAAYAAQRGIDGSAASLATDPDVVAKVSVGVQAANSKLSRVEQIKRFRILPRFWEPGGDEVTLTMKLRRKPVAERYAAEIDEMYAGAVPTHVLQAQTPVTA
ncbi:fatty acid--CoA ligase FadD11 [Hoyosella subflava]|uniref:Acyl-CoA synthetase n=1 Tax=Hoyosella subflava (strain DSM 45089 / JCM 17490 / NBRC 109087 / DQS3-9A1) TaxID=443218 RepID=F6EQY9_HOYSD|nr:fatty acid--CoA ligase FadD11 [Hoyosella subflava]AEF40676.1 Fatty-acid-CoA ligase fadD11 [Hoyosella subflava DQS3-9A1]